MVERRLVELEQRRPRRLRAVCDLEAASCRRVSRAASSGSVDSARCPRPLRVPGAGTHTQATPTGANSRLWRSPSRARRADAGHTPSARTRARRQLPAARELGASAWLQGVGEPDRARRSSRGDDARFTASARLARRGRIHSGKRRGHGGLTAEWTKSSRSRVPLRDKLLRQSAKAGQAICGPCGAADPFAACAEHRASRASPGILPVSNS